MNIFTYVNSHSENALICDLLWHNRKQVARQMFPLLAVQACTVYCMTNIGIQPDNTQTTDAVRSGVTSIIIVKKSLCY